MQTIQHKNKNGDKMKKQRINIKMIIQEKNYYLDNGLSKKEIQIMQNNRLMDNQIINEC